MNRLPVAHPVAQGLPTAFIDNNAPAHAVVQMSSTAAAPPSTALASPYVYAASRVSGPPPPAALIARAPVPAVAAAYPSFPPPTQTRPPVPDAQAVIFNRLLNDAKLQCELPSSPWSVFSLTMPPPLSSSLISSLSTSPGPVCLSPHSFPPSPPPQALYASLLTHSFPPSPSLPHSGPVCLETIDATTYGITSCGHLMCQSCLAQLPLANNGRTLCPLCRGNAI